MTNTRITDPEILESRYPVILKEFSIRKNSGAKGKFNGGDGLVRHFKFLDDLDLSLLTERRVYAPYGLDGAQDGKLGENWLICASGKEEKLASKVSLKLKSGDELRVLTPGGGGFGK
jgi:5-oxoprolinase (ATP-hydrolysing)